MFSVPFSSILTLFVILDVFSIELWPVQCNRFKFPVDTGGLWMSLDKLSGGLTLGDSQGNDTVTLSLLSLVETDGYGIPVGQKSPYAAVEFRVGVILAKT